MQENPHTIALRPNWRQVAAFLVLTFGLTYLLDLLLYLTAGYGETTSAVFLVQFQMLIPAAVAIVLLMFVFRDSPIFHLNDRPKWFFYFYLAYVAIHLCLAIGSAFISNNTYLLISNVVLQLLWVGGLVLVVVLRLVSGRESFQRAGLSGGKWWQYIVFGLALVAVYGLMTALNVAFGLGQAVDLTDTLTQGSGDQAAALQTIPDFALLLIVGFQAVIIGPILGLLVAFGEEYGWRGYLQGELIKLGKVRGLLLLGVIWGLWHAPIILMGHNYPGYPILGVLLMTWYTVILAFFFGYAMLKSGSVWLAAFLHGLNNQVLAFLTIVVYKPDDPVFSFGIGLFGLIVLSIAVIILLLADRKEWTTPVEVTTHDLAAV